MNPWCLPGRDRARRPAVRGTARPVSPSELLPLYRLGAIPPAPFVLTPELLRGIDYRG